MDLRDTLKNMICDTSIPKRVTRAMKCVCFVLFGFLSEEFESSIKTSVFDAA